MRDELHRINFNTFFRAQTILTLTKYLSYSQCPVIQWISTEEYKYFSTNNCFVLDCLKIIYSKKVFSLFS